jgi:hypothetical protein
MRASVCLNLVALLAACNFSRDDFDNSSDLEIARIETSGPEFDGMIDEVRIASEIRPLEWLQTYFNNQSDPGAFHTLGAEEDRP